MSPEGKNYTSLRRFNIIMALLHFVQGMAMLNFSTDFRLPINTLFVEFSPAAGKLIPVIKEFATLPIGLMVAGFLFLSSLAHLMVSLPRIYRWYVRNLERGINPARWIEYSVSSSLMIVVIAMLAGMYDAAALLLIFFLNAMMILFGWMMELHNQSTLETNWTAYWFGVLAGIIPWVAVGLHLFGAGGEAGGPPDFVYWIYFSIFLFFNVFALNMVLQYKRVGKWKDYLFGERMYIILSLVAKSLLAWQVWAGTLRPV
jgi:hypothetical protein